MSVDKSHALLKVIANIQMFSNLGQESANPRTSGHVNPHLSGGRQRVQDSRSQ